ncbi:cyclic pyranopterin phosphate synthase MoaA [Niabella ginsenosidivorans]|uniref:GTP 3',8-cyclase n=2 Tax=Niabella ginsenosidivorans TaxID=1176587 RepID=A0A1A9HYR4_9BACT|nr:cyclic pyranopterin phosphate synthase MoaA [Niabella ginsenosidivorans]
MITDSYGRIINYLRLAVTDRCNLRCTYCMPEAGLDWRSRKELMTYEEMLRICSLLVKMGIEKIRITGGEPFVRKDVLPFLQNLSLMNGLQELTLTTNGLLTAPLVPELKRMGIKSVNLSLDTLDKNRFIRIARRDGLDKVLKTLDALLADDIAVKINTVVMEHCNITDIVPLIQLTKTAPVSVRFIEEMPFNGGTHPVSPAWSYLRILEHIREHFPGIQKITDAPHSTSFNYHIPGHKGNIGIIAAYTRSFCGSCNRLRVTPTGVLRTCLYDAGTFNLKEIIRGGCTDEELETMITNAVLKKPTDGWEAENRLAAQKSAQQSMATIGG